MDDEEKIRRMGKNLLERLGYRVETAADGREAVEKFQSARESKNPYAAVILDLTVRGGMGGRKALEALKKIDPGVRAIVSSGYSRNTALADYRKLGFRGALAKPYSIEKISRVLADVIGADDRTGNQSPQQNE